MQKQRKHKTVDYCESSNLHKQFHFSDVAQSSPLIEHAVLTSSRKTRQDIFRNAHTRAVACGLHPRYRGARPPRGTTRICRASQQHASTDHLAAASQNSHGLRINLIRTNMMIIKWLDYLLCETENELTTVAADTGSRTKRLIPECQ